MVQPHAGSVLRLAWAHPEFGTVLATSSDDSTVAIWEEQIGRAAGSEPPLEVCVCLSVCAFHNGVFFSCDLFCGIFFFSLLFLFGM